MTFSSRTRWGIVAFSSEDQRNAAGAHRFPDHHRIKFSDLDPYNHMTTTQYATYYVDHRMEGLRDRIGWDLKALGALPFMAWVRRMEIDYVKPVRADQEITITSFVREFRGPDAIIACTMADTAGKTGRQTLPRCFSSLKANATA